MALTQWHYADQIVLTQQMIGQEKGSRITEINNPGSFYSPTLIDGCLNAF